MRKLIIISLLMTTLLFAQTWKNAIDLNISAGNNERIGLYTDSNGNHLIVQTASQINYYLYNSAGSILRSSTIDSHSESKRLSLVTGSEGNVYVIYKKGSDIKSKRTINGGASWTTLTPIDMTYSTSDGMDAVSSDDYTHLSWSEKQGSSDDYETYYMKINNNASGWISRKEVTDEEGIKGGIPSITLASNRVTVGFTNHFDPEFGDVYTREIVNNSWQSSNQIVIPPSLKSVFINDDSKTHAFVYELGDCPGLCNPIHLTHYMSDLGSNNWIFESIMGDYSSPESVPEHDIVSGVVTNNNILNIVLFRDIYKYWDGSQFLSFSVGTWGTNIKVSAAGNDVYVAWIESGTVNLRQKDYTPITPQNFDGTTANNHPKITWDNNTEADLEHYEVWKKQGTSSYVFHSTTINNYYIDTAEDVVTGPHQQNEGDIYYKALAVDIANNKSGFTSEEHFRVEGEPQYSIDDFKNRLELQIARTFALEQNYPNPFNPVTKIFFSLAEQSEVSLIIFDISGKVITELVKETKEAGFYETQFNGSNLVSGIYVYKMQARGLETGQLFSDLKRMLLIK